MPRLSKPVPQVTSPMEIAARLAAPRIFVSEKAEDYAALRAALFAELDPRTPYETSLAESLVRYEWEMARLQRFRDAAILAAFREVALKALLTGDPTGLLRDRTATEDDHLLIRDLVSPDPEERRLAEKDYQARCTWDPADLLGPAYARASGRSAMEDRVADLERRRRALRADYAALKAASRCSFATDAEVVEADR